MKNKGQLAIPIVAFVIIMIALIFLAPILLKVINEIMIPVNETISDIDSNAATQGYGAVSKFVNMLDAALMIIFFILIVLMLVSAFLIDNHPAFLIIYLVASMFLFIFSSPILDASDRIWDSSDFALEQNQLPITNFMRQTFGGIMIGVYVITGIILFAKFKGGGGDV